MLDFEVRFLALLSAATMRSGGSSVAAVGRSPGLGEWIGVLRAARQQLGACPGLPAARVAGAVDEVLNLYDRGVPTAPLGLRDVKRLRDHISHGGPLPTGHDVAATMDGLVRAISVAITDCLSDAGLRIADSDTDAPELWPSFVWGEEEEVCLWPFMYVTADNAWHMYSNFSRQDRPVFLSFGAELVRTSPSDEAISAALNTLLKARSSGPTLRDFINDVRLDLEGFADEDSDPLYSEHEQGFEYYWKKATGEGSGTEPRRDYFRLGPDNTREWEAESGWVPYSTYLRRLANWPVVATRLRQTLEKTEARLATEERESLGWAPGQRGTTRMARVIVSDMDGSNSLDCSFSDLIDRVDEYLQANRGQTQVVFINGEAGIGKTRAMVEAAKSRARNVEQSAGDEDVSGLPLFLYVRSTGQVLDSLPTVVSGAVASTRNLTDAGVKALCRNGLMTLLIDGFDELLGGVGYSDAIGSLRPWLNDLGGRGVVVVSARSSYYMGQYRSSVARANEQGLPSVRHRIAEVQRWSSDDVASFLDEYGVSTDSLTRLSKYDRELLGLPFFARVFVETVRNPGQGDFSRDASLTERLLSQYVAREEGKLGTGQGDTVLLDRTELRRTFEVLAEFMADSDEREADITELETAAEFAIEQELAARRGLKQRLPVLCGLAAAKGDALTSRFRFQHELFFDQFLAGAASHYLVSGQRRLFLGMLKQSHWRAATVAGVVDAAGAARTADAIAGFQPSAEGMGHEMRSTVAATNLGALWAAIIRTTGRMPAADIVDAVFSDELDLSHVPLEGARMVGCELSSLVLPSASGWQLNLKSTKIKKIETHQAPPNLSGLRGVRHADLTQLLLPSALLERKDRILEALRKHGAEVADADLQDESAPSLDVQAAHHFLTTLASRAEYSVVLRGTAYQPDDNRLKWTQAYGPAAWRRFVTELDTAGLAAIEPFSASGERKLRLRLKCNTATIMGNDGTRAGVDTFWQRLEGR